MEEKKDEPQTDLEKNGKAKDKLSEAELIIASRGLLPPPEEPQSTYYRINPDRG